MTFAEAATRSFWMRNGAISMCIGVGLGAFGAHGLKGKVDDYMIGVWKTACEYHIYHSLGMIAVANAPKQSDYAGWLFLSGIGLFSGSLYTMVLTNNRKLGAITPIGGLSFMLGWFALFLKHWQPTM